MTLSIITQELLNGRICTTMLGIAEEEKGSGDEWARTSCLVSAQLQASTTCDTLEHHDLMLSACRALQAVLLSDLPRTEGQFPSPSRV